MSRNDRRARLAGALVLTLLGGVVSESRAAGGHGPGVQPTAAVVAAPPVTRRVAYKPSYHVRQNRTLFLNGYAGFNYGRGPVEPITPTLYAPGNGRPFGGLIGRLFGR